MLDAKTIVSWVCAYAMAILTAVAEQATAIEPDRLVWMLGVAGALIGGAILPSVSLWRTVVKTFFGCVIAGVLAAPFSTSHLAPDFVNTHVAALWLGFGGPALFMATIESSALIDHVFKVRKS